MIVLNDVRTRDTFFMVQGCGLALRTHFLSSAAMVAPCVSAFAVVQVRYPRSPGGGYFRLSKRTIEKAHRLGTKVNAYMLQWQSCDEWTGPDKEPPSLLSFGDTQLI